MNPETTIGVLFVCLGNICRSPVAEGTFAQLVRERGLADRFHIDSCGTAAYHVGQPANATSRQVAREAGIELTSRARQFALSDFTGFHYILTMDRSNYDGVLGHASAAQDRERVFMFRAFEALTGPPPPDFVPRRVAVDVPDPYYGGRDGFEEVQRIVSRTAAKLLDYLVARHRLVP